MRYSQHKHFSGFTLAELLIALAILGVIAAFAIPKVLDGGQNSRRNAVLKESISLIHEAMYIAKLEGHFPEVYPDGRLYSWRPSVHIFPYINMVKQCPTNASVQGCWDIPTQGDPMPFNAAQRGGFTLHNGTTVCGLVDNATNSPTAIYNIMWLDWNGSEGSNVEGDDQIHLLICYAPNCVIPDSGQTGYARVGPASGASATLYREVFK